MRPAGRLSFHGQARGTGSGFELDGPGPAGIGDEGHAVRGEREGDHIGERDGMVLLIEHVGRRYEVEAAEVVGHPSPVKQSHGERFRGVYGGVVADALEGGLLVVARDRNEAPPGRDNRRQAQATTKLQEAAAFALQG